MVTSFVVYLFLIPFVLPRIGAAAFGAWAVVASVLAIGALADAGVRTEVIRRVGAAVGLDDREAVLRAVREGTTLIAVIATMMASLVALLAPLIRRFAFPGGVTGYAPTELEWVIRATALLLAVQLVGNGYFAVLRGVQRGDVEGDALIVSVPVNAAVTVACVYGGLGMWALLVGSAAQLTVQLAWRTWKARILIPELRFRVAVLNAATARGYIALSGLALVSQVSDVVDSQWDKLVLSHFVGSASVAAFQVGTLLVLQAKEVSILPLLPLMAAVSELRAREPERMLATYRFLSRLAFVIAGTALGGLFLFGPAFIHLWLGNEVPQAGDAIRLFTLAIALNVMSAPLAMRAFGEGWYSSSAASAAANMVVNGLSSFLLTMAIGFDGALVGSILGNVTGVAVLLVLLRRRLGSAMTWPSPVAFAVAVAADGLCIIGGVDHAGSWSSLALWVCLYCLAVGGACAVLTGLLADVRRGALLHPPV